MQLTLDALCCPVLGAVPGTSGPFDVYQPDDEANEPPQVQADAYVTVASAA
ncbi:hypothetical protein ACH4LE_11375 [Streptomyces sp. NPDC017413]|uniref:hypothetical protein n=1 Tax=Streptomyces sp. NPDC017413 TaxID=3364994 RepID=UPI003796AC5F